MAVGCGAKCAKSVLVTFNFLFWMSGCALITLGVWLFVDGAKVRLLQLALGGGTAAVYYLAYALVTLGGLVLLVGFVGCCGALQESRCMLIAYFVFLFVLLCLELAVAIVTLVYREDILSSLDTRLTEQLRARYGHDYNNNDGFTQAIDLAQYRFNCCGIHGDSDYMYTKWWNDSALTNEPRNVPLTCCVLSHSEVPNSGSPISVVSRVFAGTVEEPWQHPLPEDDVSCQSVDPLENEGARHKKGCFPELELWFKKESAILIATGIGIAAFQVLGMICCICLCKNLGDDI